jgi:hypothetical protein
MWRWLFLGRETPSTAKRRIASLLSHDHLIGHPEPAQHMPGPGPARAGLAAGGKASFLSGVNEVRVRSVRTCRTFSLQLAAVAWEPLGSSGPPHSLVGC